MARRGSHSVFGPPVAALEAKLPLWRHGTEAKQEGALNVVSRILAIIIMGAIALGLVAFPIGMSKTSLGMGNSQSYALEISVPFLALAALTIFIALWAPTARIAWGRLCVRPHCFRAAASGRHT